MAQAATPAVVNIALWKLRPPTRDGDPPRRVKVYGSGFVIDPSGIIVTNRHVIDGALNIKVIFDNGDQLDGKLLGAAPITDIAVIKVNVDHPLPALLSSREVRRHAESRRTSVRLDLSIVVSSYFPTTE